MFDKPNEWIWGCPSGWTCPGSGTVTAPSIHFPNSQGSQSFRLGLDEQDSGVSTSQSFALPDNAAKLKFLRAGNGAAPSGLYLRTTDGDTDLCTTAPPPNNDNTMIEIECSVSGYGGQSVYFFAQDESATARLIIDHIRFVDSEDNHVYLDFECRLPPPLMPPMPPPEPPPSPPEQPIPSPPPPSPPPFVSVVSVTFTAAGDVSSFDSASFRSSLLSYFTDATDAMITVTAASVSIATRLIMSSAAAASSAESTLSSATPTALSSSLGITIESVSSPTVAVEEIIAPSPPPPSPPLSASCSNSCAGSTCELVRNLRCTQLALLGCSCGVRLAVIERRSSLPARRSCAAPVSNSVDL